MCLLALQKLKDLDGFATMFLNYDLLAQRWMPYAMIYPFAKGLAGVLMISGALIWVSVPVALFIGGIGAVSVFKAVYVDRRELKCACVRRRQQRPARVRLPNGKPHDVRHGRLDDCEARGHGALKRRRLRCRTITETTMRAGRAVPT